MLWTAALLRLLIPFSVPFSWSAYTLLQNAASDTRAVLESHSAGNPQSESGTGSQGSSARNLHLESEPDSQDSSARTPQSGSEAGAQSIFGQIPGQFGIRCPGRRAIGFANILRKHFRRSASPCGAACKNTSGFKGNLGSRLPGLCNLFRVDVFPVLPGISDVAAFRRPFPGYLA